MHAEAVLLVDHRKAEIGEGDIVLEQRMGADHDMDEAARQRVQHHLARTAFLAAGQQRDLQAGRLGERLDRLVMLAGEDFGRCHQRGLGAGLDRLGHGEQCHHRLARADIALQQAQHAAGRAHIAADLRQRLALRSGEREGQGGGDPVADPAVAFERAAIGAPEAAAQQGERKLAGEQLVESETPARQAMALDVAVVGRPVQGSQGIVEARPALRGEQAVIQPFRQARQRVERPPDGLVEEFLGEPLGERIDRFEAGQLVALVLRHDIIGVGHLQLGAIALDPSGQQAHGADRELTLEIGALRVEEDQLDIPGVVLADDAIGRPAVASRGGVMLLHPDQEGRELPGHGLGNRGLGAPVGQARGQMKQQVDDARCAATRQIEQLAEHSRKARADTFDADDTGEIGVEQRRPRR